MNEFRHFLQIIYLRLVFSLCIILNIDKSKTE